MTRKDYSGDEYGAFSLVLVSFHLSSCSLDGHRLPVRDSCSCLETTHCLIVDLTPLIQFMVGVAQQEGSASITCRAQLRTECAIQGAASPMNSKARGLPLSGSPAPYSSSPRLYENRPPLKLATWQGRLGPERKHNEQNYGSRSHFLIPLASLAALTVLPA